MTPAEQIALLRDALEELCSGHSIGGAKQARAALAATAAQPVPAADVPEDGEDCWKCGESGGTSCGDQFCGLLVSEPVAPTVPTPGPWRDWSGGKQPVPDEIYVDVKFRNGSKPTNKAVQFRWNDMEHGCDIIAWRYAAVTPVPTEPMIDGYPLWSGIPQPEQTAEAEVADMMAIAHLNGMEQGKKLAQQSNAPALSDAAKLCEMNAQTIRLHAGELNGREMLAVKAVLAFVASRIRDLAAQGGNP